MKKKTLSQLIYLAGCFSLVFFVTGSALPQIAAAQTETMKNALQSIIVNLDQLTKIKPKTGSKIQPASQIKLWKETLTNIISLTNAQNDELKNKLIALTDLEEEHKTLRDALLNTIGNQDNYIESVRQTLEKELSLVKIKELATQFRNWRQVVYHPAIKEVSNFLLVFESRHALQIAEARLNSIRTDLRKIQDVQAIKNSPLPKLFEEAAQVIGEAEELQQAAELVLVRTSETSVQKLIEDVQTALEKTYQKFLAMSTWLQQDH